MLSLPVLGTFLTTFDCLSLSLSLMGVNFERGHWTAGRGALNPTTAPPLGRASPQCGYNFFPVVIAEAIAVAAQTAALAASAGLAPGQPSPRPSFKAGGYWPVGVLLDFGRFWPECYNPLEGGLQHG